FIPQAIIVARSYMECVAARFQICVERLATALRVLPFVVVPFQSVSEMNLLRNHEAQCCVIDFEAADVSRKVQVMPDRITHAIGGNPFHHYVGWQLIRSPHVRIKGLYNVVVSKPKTAIA